MLYTIDTHALIWFETKDRRLGTKARQVLNDAKKGKHQILIPAIVVTEVVWLLENRKVKDLELKNFLEQIRKLPQYKITPIDWLVLKKFIEISADLEMHDRLIVATAVLTNSPVITKDSKIKATPRVQTVW